MKSLKATLVATYIVLIILLLLTFLKCEGQKPQKTVDTPVIKETFKADVVMCIDWTSSMRGLLNTIKENAVSFYPDMKEKCLSYGKEITSMRIRVIGFGDLSDALPYELSPFFNMPDQEDEYRSFVSRMALTNGGDWFEIGYDALGLAMSSDWMSGEDVHQVIVLWTDAPSHPLSTSVPGPRSLDEMKDIWYTKMNQKGKRLILFSPDSTWSPLTEMLDKSVRHDVSSGFSDDDYEEIIRALSESI